MGLLSGHTYGIIATKEVAYAKKKPICHSFNGCGENGINCARK